MTAKPGYILTGGTIVTASGCFTADVRIEGEVVAAVGHHIALAGDEEIKADGCYLFPGGIDPHTHFDLPVGNVTTADDFGSGTAAAAIGGTTTVIDFATQEKGQTLRAALDNWHRKAGGKCHVDYGFHMAISDVSPDVLKEMPVLVRQEGVTSFKLYMAYKGAVQVDDGALYRALAAARQCSALVGIHCENGDVIQALVEEALAQGFTAAKYHALTRPPELEAEAVNRAVTLARLAGAPLYLVHLSSAKALEVVEQARREGGQVFAETCPQYLLLDRSRYESEDVDAAKYVISPPLRQKKDQQSLWHGLQRGSIMTIGSDHCPFTLEQKQLGRSDFSRIPNGAPGVENRFGLLYTFGVLSGRISLSQFVALTSTNAAKLFGLYPRKGAIAPGSDADIVVWDPAVLTTISAISHCQRVDYNPYEGFTQNGQAAYVFLRGKPVVKDGRLAGISPRGRYLHRQAFSQGGA